MNDCPSLDSLQHGGAQVAAHLAVCPACQSLVALMNPDDPGDRTQAEPLAAGGAGASAAWQLPRVPSESYELGAEIGRGGMGRILSAHDRRIGRTVAIKEMLSAAPAALARFEREARITARLQHPGIVSIYEVGRWPDGRPFYAMPILPGRTLRQAIEAAPDLEGRLALIPAVIAAAEAVAYAHSRRIIHRDLTPANILLGSFGETIVIDWGVAKELDEPEGARNGGPDPAAAKLTADGAVVGTLAYIPPEQADGGPVDERADIYALGAILHHVLTGHRPFHGLGALAVVARLREREAPPLAAEGPVPRDLVAIVRRAMAVDPGQRYRTAMALVEDLRLYLSGGREILDYIVYAVAAMRRRARWATGAFILGLALTASVFAQLPRTYRVQIELPAPELPPPEVPWPPGGDPQFNALSAAMQAVRSRQNLADVATRLDLLANRKAARSGLERLLDRLRAPASESERAARLLDELERETSVGFTIGKEGQHWIQVSADWPEPRAAHRLAEALLEGLLQSRESLERAGLLEGLSALTAREKMLRREIEEERRADDRKVARQRSWLDVASHAALVKRIEEATLQLETTRARHAHVRRAFRPPQVPTRPVSPRRSDGVLAGLLLSLVLAALVAVAVDRRTIRRAA